MSKELVQALDALEQEKGIKAEVLVEAIEEALKKAYEKNYDESENVEVQFDQKKGNIKVYSVKTVVEEIDEPYEQITLEEALELNKAYEIGDEIRFARYGDDGSGRPGKLYRRLNGCARTCRCVHAAPATVESC